MASNLSSAICFFTRHIYLGGGHLQSRGRWCPSVEYIVRLNKNLTIAFLHIAADIKDAIGTAANTKDTIDIIIFSRIF